MREHTELVYILQNRVELGIVYFFLQILFRAILLLPLGYLDNIYIFFYSRMFLKQGHGEGKKPTAVHWSGAFAGSGSRARVREGVGSGAGDRAGTGPRDGSGAKAGSGAGTGAVVGL